MKLIKDLREGMRVAEVYLCKTRQIQLTKNGKEYCSVTLQDKSGSIDGKIWDLGNPGIGNFEARDFVFVDADVSIFNNNPQLRINRIRKAEAGEYTESDYLPVSARDIGAMYDELLTLVNSVKNKDLSRLLKAFFVEDPKFIEKYKFSSAAKSVHHGFVGGLLEHSLGVAKLCNYMCGAYPYLKHDLLISVALLHDIGKIREITPYPDNDYSDEGQLLGHIVIGCEMIGEKIKQLPDFNPKLESEIKHCILAHHGEFEYGSPKKPALAEAMALNLADNTDAKVEIMKELLDAAGENNGWLGYNKLLESNVRRTQM